MSPELWKNKPYNDKSDVWAMGCLLYEMAELKPPFDGANMKGLARKVMKGNYHPISGSEPSPLPPPHPPRLQTMLRESKFQRRSTFKH